MEWIIWLPIGACIGAGFVSLFTCGLDHYRFENEMKINKLLSKL